jgi:hypothetical protein
MGSTTMNKNTHLKASKKNDIKEPVFLCFGTDNLKDGLEVEFHEKSNGRSELGRDQID